MKTDDLTKSVEIKINHIRLKTEEIAGECFLLERQRDLSDFNSLCELSAVLEIIDCALLRIKKL